MVTTVRSKSLRQLANELGVSPAYLSQVKNGKKKPSARVLTITRLMFVLILDIIVLVLGNRLVVGQRTPDP